MSTKVSYANLKLKTNTDVNTFDFNGVTIEVLKYLPIEDKYDLVHITLQKSLDKSTGLYDSVKMDMFFQLHLVYMYTNLSFTEKQRENESKLYDTLASNGFIDKMINAMEEEEYTTLFEYIDEAVQDRFTYGMSTAAIVKSLIADLPANAEAAAKIVENFNPEQYQAVIDFATAANGGRPVVK